MIGIRSYSNEILKFLPQIGISSSSVSFNPPSTKGLSCLVSVGGENIWTNHCYIQMEGTLPYIQCHDPASLQTQPELRPFILCALAKAKEIDQHGYHPPVVKTTIRPTIADIQVFDELLKETPGALLSVDIECDKHNHEITVVGFAFQRVGEGGFVETHAISIPLLSEQFNYWSEEDEVKVWKFVADLLGNSHPKVFQNFIFDTMMLSYYGVGTKGVIYDTMIAAHYIQPELPKSLADLGRLYLISEIWKGRNNWTSNESLWNYNAKDAAYTLLILNKQMEKMIHDKIIRFFDQHLVPLSGLVLSLCEQGWNLDASALSTYKASLENQTKTLHNGLSAFAKDLVRPKVTYLQRKGPPKQNVQYYYNSCSSTGKQYNKLILPLDTKKLSALAMPVYEQKVEEREFNPNSSKQVIEILKEFDIKIPIKDGKETVSELALIGLLENPNVPDEVKTSFIRPLMEYRGIEKLLSTYCNANPDYDGKYRFSIVVCGTVEGRFSSKQTPWETGFNSQNIPKSFRKMIVPHEPKYKIVNMDFKQADPHMVAWLAGEEKMLEIMNSGKNLHAYTASMIYGEDITIDLNYKESKKYKVGKAADNGLNYGMQINRFIETCKSQGLSLTFEEAQEAYDGYFKLYSNIRPWQNSIKQQIIQTRTLTTPFGRKRYFYGYLTNKLMNDALAYIPPTTVADALNAGWLELARSPKFWEMRADVLGQCHDSLMLQCHETEVHDLCYLLQNVYREVIFSINGKDCNLPIEIEIGDNWGEMAKWSPL